MLATQNVPLVNASSNASESLETNKVDTDLEYALCFAFIATN